MLRLRQSRAPALGAQITNTNVSGREDAGLLTAPEEHPTGQRVEASAAIHASGFTRIERRRRRFPRHVERLEHHLGTRLRHTRSTTMQSTAVLYAFKAALHRWQR